MKKYMITVLLAAALLATACESEGSSSSVSDNKINTSSSASQQSEIAEETNAESIAEKSSESTDSEITDTEESQEKESSPESEISETEDIQAAGELQYEKSCQVTWNMLIGCPYNLDYNTMTNSGAVLINDPAVSSLDDIKEDYCQVFATPDAGLYEKYFESESGVYCFDGGRGSNIYYVSTDLELVSESETQAVFNAVSHYADPETGEAQEDKTCEFVMIRSDGEWKTQTFTLPN